MDFNSDIGSKIQELQLLEQNLQGFLMEKQSIQIELNESINALQELQKTNDEVYKIIGGIMLKSEKNFLIKEIEERKKILELRISSIEKQEKLVEKKTNKIREDIAPMINRKKEDSE